MQYPEEIRSLLKDISNRLEIERVKDGIGKKKMAVFLGMSYNTYKSFLRQDRMTLVDTIVIVLRYLASKNAFESEWNTRLWDILSKHSESLCYKKVD